MVTRTRAARLRRLADRRRRDGARSVLASFALGTLIQAGDRGDPNAVDEIWAMWLDEPDEALWERLARWRRPALDGWTPGGAGWDPMLRGLSLVALDEGSVDDAAFRTALIDAAVRTDHPVGDIARRRILAGDQDVVDAVCAEAPTRPVLAALCVEHDLAPADPAAGAVFFLLTGQVERYRAADPDHSLLALGYQSATADERRRLRTVLIDTGDLDVARMLVGVGQHDRRTRLTAEEARYLTARLADRRAWDELWRVVQHLPLVEAVTAARLLGGWRPAGAPDHALADRLAGTDPQPLAEAHRDLTTFDTTRVEVPGWVRDGAFTPDGRRLAVLTRQRSQPGKSTLSVVDLADGTLVEQHEVRTQIWKGDVHFVTLGDVLIAMDLRFLPGSLGHPSDHHIVVLWRSDGHPREPESLPAVRELAPSPAHGGGSVAHTRADELEFRGDDGDLVSTVRLRDALGRPGRDRHVVRVLATEPGSGRLAVAGDGLAVFDARDAAHVRLLAHRQRPGDWPICRAVFVDQNRLVTTDVTHGVLFWRLTGNRLERHTAPAEPTTFDRLGLAKKIDVHRSPIVIPQRGEIAVIDNGGSVWYLDAENRTVIDEPRELTGTRGSALWGAPGEGRHALGGDGFVDVVTPVHPTAVTALAGRPLAEMTPADLATVSEALRDIPPATRPLLELLHDWLEQRFAFDVELGTAAPATGGPHDIAIAPEREGP